MDRSDLTTPTPSDHPSEAPSEAPSGHPHGLMAIWMPPSLYAPYREAERDGGMAMMANS